MSPVEGRSVRGLLRDVVPLLVLLMVLSPFVVYAVPELVGGDRSYIVLSGSMEPKISTGGVVIVERVDPADVSVGDVITFRRTGSDVAVTHRVIEVMESDQGLAFRTKGDANEEADPGEVGAGDVIGRVILTIPYLGRVVMFIGSSTGFVLIIALPIGLLLLSELWRYASGPESAAADADEDAEVDDFEWYGGADVGTASAALPGDEDGLTFTKADLSISSVALFLLAAYAAWAAYESQTPLAITIAVGAATTFVLVVGVRQFGLGADPVPVGATAAAPVVSDGGIEGAVQSDSTATAGVVPAVTLAETHRDLPRITVGSLADLSDLADRLSRPVVRDGPDGDYLVVNGDVLFVAASSPSPPDADPDLDADQDADPDAAGGGST